MSGDSAGAVRIAVDTAAPNAALWIAGPGVGIPALSYIAYADMTSVSEVTTPEYMAVPMLNRPENLLTYQGSSNRDVTLVLRFAVQKAYDNAAAMIRQEVLRPALWIDALKTSFRDASGAQHAPPPVYLIIGDALYMRAVVTTCDISWQGPWYYLDDLASDALPMMAEVRVTFTSVATSTLSRGSSGFRYQKTPVTT